MTLVLSFLALSCPFYTRLPSLPFLCLCVPAHPEPDLATLPRVPAPPQHLLALTLAGSEPKPAPIFDPIASSLCLSCLITGVYKHHPHYINQRNPFQLRQSQPARPDQNHGCILISTQPTTKKKKLSFLHNHRCFQTPTPLHQPTKPFSTSPKPASQAGPKPRLHFDLNTHHPLPK